MFKSVFQFEITRWFKSPLIYFFGLCYFLFMLVTMLGTSGYFDGPNTSSQQVSFINTPFALCNNGFLITKLLLFLVAFVISITAHRDFKSKSYSFLYAYPLIKSQYLSSKFFTALLVIIISSVICFSGLASAELIIGNENAKLSDFNPFGYLVLINIYHIPTVIFLSIVAFIITSLSRNAYAGIVVIICAILFQMIIENVFFNAPKLLSILDPFGQNAFYNATKGWGFEMRNSGTLPINTLVIINRGFWLLLGLLFYYVFYKKFDFQYARIFKSLLKRKTTHDLVQKSSLVKDHKIESNFSMASRLKTTMSLIKFNCVYLLKNWLFIIIALTGIAAVFFLQLRVCNTGEFNLLPVTRILLGAPLSIYFLIIVLTTILFSGILLNTNRRFNIGGMHDATPIKNWQLIISNLGAISLLQMILVSLFFIVSISIQVFNSYYHFELKLYFFHLLVLTFPILFVWNAISQFCHSLFSSIYLSTFLLVCLWMGIQGLAEFGIDSNVFKINTLPYLSYSDFQGYGSNLPGQLKLIIYWLLFGCILLTSLIFIWRRGSDINIRERCSIFKLRLSKTNWIPTSIFILAFLWQGCNIFMLEKDGKEYSNHLLNQSLKSHKLNWAKYRNLTIPKITDIDLNLNIYPSQNYFDANGFYTLVNQSNQPIDSIIIRKGFDELSQINWNSKAELLLEDTLMKTQLFKLKKTLQPKDSVQFNFEIKSQANSTFTKNSNVLSKGTFLKHDFLPRIGYQFFEHERSLDQEGIQQYNFYHRDAHKLKIHTTISTSGSQYPIAPGNLISKKEKDERVFLEYKTEHPVKFNFSFHSSNFEIKTDTYNNVQIEVFHNPGHDNNNINHMIEGAKAALDYNSSIFGEYPYNHFRIIEFPHTEESFAATLTTNNIPSSEKLFIINTEAMQEKTNLPYYVMVHELTHEWFGNQVMPAAAEGGKMLTESITEFITLQIYRQNLGQEKAKLFLDTQRKRYERGRNSEKSEESPLYKVKSKQQYIAYAKGAIVLDKISNIIGTSNMNHALRKYLDTYKSQTSKYPISTDFIEILKTQADSSHHQIIDQLLKT